MMNSFQATPGVFTLGSASQKARTASQKARNARNASQKKSSKHSKKKLPSVSSTPPGVQYVKNRILRQSPTSAAPTNFTACQHEISMILAHPNEIRQLLTELDSSTLSKDKQQFKAYVTALCELALGTLTVSTLLNRVIHNHKMMDQMLEWLLSASQIPGLQMPCIAEKIRIHLNGDIRALFLYTTVASKNDSVDALQKYIQHRQIFTQLRGFGYMGDIAQISGMVCSLLKGVPTRHTKALYKQCAPHVKLICGNMCENDAIQWRNVDLKSVKKLMNRTSDHPLVVAFKKKLRPLCTTEKSHRRHWAILEAVAIVCSAYEHLLQLYLNPSQPFKTIETVNFGEMMGLKTILLNEQWVETRSVQMIMIDGEPTMVQLLTPHESTVFPSYRYRVIGKTDEPSDSRTIGLADMEPAYIPEITVGRIHDILATVHTIADRNEYTKPILAHIESIAKEIGDEKLCEHYDELTTSFCEHSTIDDSFLAKLHSAYELSLSQSESIELQIRAKSRDAKRLLSELGIQLQESPAPIRYIWSQQYTITGGAEQPLEKTLTQVHPAVAHLTRPTAADVNAFHQGVENWLNYGNQCITLANQHREAHEFQRMKRQAIDVEIQTWANLLQLPRPSFLVNGRYERMVPYQSDRSRSPTFGIFQDESIEARRAVLMFIKEPAEALWRRSFVQPAEDLRKIWGESLPSEEHSKFQTTFEKLAASDNDEWKTMPPYPLDWATELRRMMERTLYWKNYWKDLRECVVCMETGPIAQYFPSNTDMCCTDAANMCWTCINRGLTSALDGGHKMKANGIQCLLTKCNDMIPQPIIRSRMNTEQFARYERLRRELTIAENPLLSWCPNPQCTNEHGVHSVVDTSLTCTRCNTNICSNCKEMEHENETCEEAEARRTGIVLTSQEHKKCPTCNVTIFRESGCLHMTCSQCSTMFCFACRRKCYTRGESDDPRELNDPSDIDGDDPEGMTSRCESYFCYHLNIRDGEVEDY